MDSNGEQAACVLAVATVPHNVVLEEAGRAERDEREGPLSKVSMAGAAVAAAPVSTAAGPAACALDPTPANSDEEKTPGSMKSAIWRKELSVQ